ncbi:hypothetical protein [Bacillus sp. NEB1478]|nr:hypothetical protein [Bacillus sp. NEB1478]WNB92074.1 hypothetical protein RGB74_20025 [Bacillus sp. NEB1478]
MKIHLLFCFEKPRIEFVDIDSWLLQEKLWVSNSYLWDCDLKVWDSETDL